MSLLTVPFRKRGAFQNTEVILDFVGVSPEAVEQVVVVHGAPDPPSVGGQSRGGEEALWGNVA